MPFPAHWSVTLALPLNNEAIFPPYIMFLAGSLLRSITIGVISAYNYRDCADEPEVYVAHTQPEIRFSTKSTVRRWNWIKVQFKILLKGTSFDSPPKNIRKCSINESHWTNIWTEKSSGKCDFRYVTVFFNEASRKVTPCFVTSNFIPKTQFWSRFRFLAWKAAKRHHSGCDSKNV